MRTVRAITRLLALLFLAGLLCAGGFAWFALTPIRMDRESFEFTVRPGVGMRAAAVDIEQAGLALPAWPFSLLGRLSGRAAAIKAGTYRIENGITPWMLLEKMARGDVVQSEITFVEGWTFRQIRAGIDAHPDLRHDTRGLSDAALLAAIGVDRGHPEGLFFPDTYLFAKGTADTEVLRRAYRAMSERLTREWRNRDPDVPYADPYQALIMASIVEKETGSTVDRPQVASVFTNRLRLGMPLQTDPTVIYGLGERFDGNLRKRDLLADTPYNTYTRTGLPPTPIAMPGAASLQAVLAPPESDLLYFVARGDGSSEFSTSLDAHNRAVARYQKPRRGQRP